jgi:hypothetical protein
LLANVAGDLCTVAADLTEDTSFSTFVGIGISANSLRVKILPSGVRINFT